MRITEWPAAERPREKLLAKGAGALSDAELLAIFLRTGMRGKTAVDLARDLIKHFGGLSQLLAANMDSFCQQKGLGTAKYVQLQATLEMGQRYINAQLVRETVLGNSMQTHAYLTHRLRHYKQEVFACLFLDAHHRLISFEELFFGTLRRSQVHVREVVRMALEKNAASVIFAHNHPSGVARASAADVAVTKTLQAALALVDVEVLDHIIVAGGEVTSMVEEKLV